jgi:hypothetical protein
MDEIRVDPGLYTYRVICGEAANEISATTTIEWVFPPAETSLEYTVVPGGVPPVYLPNGYAIAQWRSNVMPCLGTGGAPADGWAGQRPFSVGGMIVATQVPGTYDYGITCGPPGNQASAQVAIQFAVDPPPVYIRFNHSPPADPTTRDSIYLQWEVAYATSCQASGGVPGDGWSGSRPTSGFASGLRSLLPGQVTYQLTCSNSIATVERNHVVNWTGEPVATVSLSVQPQVVVLGQSFTLNWTSERATSCTASGGTPGDGWAGTRPASGSMSLQIAAIGSYTYLMTCGNSGLVATSVTVQAAPVPLISLTVSPDTIPLGDPATISWNVVGSTGCTGSGGTPDASGGMGAWPGAKATSGSVSVRPINRGIWDYILSCQAPGITAQEVARLTVGDPLRPLVTFQVMPRTVTEGSFYTVSWDVIGASTCVASGGIAGDGWTGNVPMSGMRSITATVVGTFTYGLDCSSPTGTTMAQQAVTVTARQTNPGGGGGGGGGAAGLAALGLLSLLALAARRQQLRRH